MKLIVQIPCFNEASTLPSVLADIPRSIDGVDCIEILVIDDGSTDGTADVAQAHGAHYVVRHRRNKGLARAFQQGVESALDCGADIIVNLDGDNQYMAADIPLLVTPIVSGEADVVVGDRGVLKNTHFSRPKRLLQLIGSAIVRQITRLDISDAVSGFRAASRDAAQQLHIVSEFSYTIEMLVQASSKRHAVVSVPIRTNPKTRESRLFKSIPQFLRLSGITLLRSYTMYRPLRVFFAIGMFLLILGSMPIVRFLVFYLQGQGSGHVQSLVLGGALVVMGALTFLIGIVADLISFNRRLIEQMMVRMERWDPNTFHQRKPQFRNAKHIDAASNNDVAAASNKEAR